MWTSKERLKIKGRDGNKTVILNEGTCRARNSVTLPIDNRLEGRLSYCGNSIRHPQELEATSPEIGAPFYGLKS